MQVEGSVQKAGGVQVWYCEGNDGQSRSGKKQNKENFDISQV